MRKTIMAAVKAYLAAIGRYPVAYPLAGALPPVFFTTQRAAGSDPFNRPWNGAPRSNRHGRSDDFYPVGWPELV